MQRFRDDRPADICFARGTFNSHPYVMAAMDEFLDRLDDPGRSRRSTTVSTSAGTSGRDGLNAALAEHEPAGARRQSVVDLDGRITREPSRYNWMFQYYLRAEGLALSWVGTGRLIFSLNYTDADFAEVAEALRGRGARK